MDVVTFRCAEPVGTVAVDFVKNLIDCTEDANTFPMMEETRVARV